MTGNIPLSSKGNIGKNNVIEDVEDYVEKLPDLDFVQASTRIYDKIDNDKDGILPLSKFVDLIGALEEGFIVRSWRVICKK